MPTEETVNRQLQDFVNAKTAIQSLLLRDLENYKERALPRIKQIRLG